MQVKTLKFKNKLVELILSGGKDCTWRLFDDKNLSVGDELILTNKDTGNKSGKAKIVSIFEKRLADVNDNDLIGHEKFKNRDNILETYKGYYGEEVSGDSVVKIVKFKLIK